MGQLESQFLVTPKKAVAVGLLGSCGRGASAQPYYTPPHTRVQRHGQVLYRGIPEDYDRWAEWGNDEWAFTKVMPYFRKMENDHDFPGGDFHGNDGPIPVRRYPREEWLPHAVAFQQACLDEGFRDDPDQNDPESTGVSPRARNTIEGVRISTALAYLDPARHRRGNLTIRANVTVQRIILEGKRAVGVKVESGGEQFTIEGEQIVLSTGYPMRCHRLTPFTASFRCWPGGAAKERRGKRVPRPAGGR